jgi:CelD/BcsL family acetyltransferase involved in cellulose biosynthesis
VRAWQTTPGRHARTIEMNLAQGQDLYDFMAGEDVYKKELGVNSGEMAWLTLQRPRLKFQIESALKAWRLRSQARRQAQDSVREPAA